METLVNMFRDEECYELVRAANISPEFKYHLEEYCQSIEQDFQNEWSKKRFKWLFKKHRQRKLMSKVRSRYMHPIFSVVEDCIDELLPKVINESVDRFVNIEDVPFGDKVYFTEESQND